MSQVGRAGARRGHFGGIAGHAAAAGRWAGGPFAPMTCASVESRPWSRRRWWGMVGFIFSVQLALIFWLGQTSPIRPRPAAPGLTLKREESASAGLLRLNDPTLFVLPHAQGPAGLASLTSL